MSEEQERIVSLQWVQWLLAAFMWFVMVSALRGIREAVEGACR